MKARILIFPAIGFWLMLLCVAACGSVDSNATPMSEYGVEAILTRGAEQLKTAQVMMTNEAQTPIQVTPSATIPAPQATMTAQAAQATAQAAQMILGAGKKWSVVLNDDFADDQHKWTVGQDKAIANGKYEWDIQDTENVVRGLPESASVTDFYAAIDVKLIQGAADCGMGLTFRKNDEGEYIFYVQDDRKWGFDIIHSPDPRIAQHGLSDAMIPHTQNRIAVIAQGPEMKFFVNDKYVGAVQDSTVPKGKVGVAVWNLGLSGCQVEFDNFELRVP